MRTVGGKWKFNCCGFSALDCGKTDLRAWILRILCDGQSRRERRILFQISSQSYLNESLRLALVRRSTDAHHRQTKHSLTASRYNVLDLKFPCSFEDVIGRDDVVLECYLIRYSAGGRNGSQVHYGQLRTIERVAGAYRQHEIQLNILTSPWTDRSSMPINASST